MPARPHLEFAGLTDVGRVREKNEDAITINEDLGFALLADGMGGYNAGEMASDMAVSGMREILEEGLRPRRFSFLRKGGETVGQLLATAIAEVNQRIYHKARSDPHYYGMGTTIAAAVFQDKRLTIAHIGDSRIYRFRNGELQQLTRDHSWVQDQIDTGWMTAEEAQVSEHKNLLTRALGVYETVMADINEHEVLPGDIYFLCSDGLTDMLGVDEIKKLLLKPNSKQLCEELVQRANQAGGVDNISIILCSSSQV